MLEYARDVVVALSALAIALFAWRGLQAWRKELIGRARFETARSMVRLGFELEANFARVRSQQIYAYEWADRESQADETSAESQVLNQWHARIKLSKFLTDSLNKVRRAEWEAAILFDEPAIQAIRDAVKSYRESYTDLSTAISEYYDARLQEAKSGELLPNQDWLRELRDIIYQIPDDKFALKVNAATEKLSLAAKQYVR